jgi:hypothetical protein
VPRVLGSGDAVKSSNGVKNSTVEVIAQHADVLAKQTLKVTSLVQPELGELRRAMRQQSVLADLIERHPRSVTRSNPQDRR